MTELPPQGPQFREDQQCQSEEDPAPVEETGQDD
jgi:hypothetical protein